MSIDCCFGKFLWKCLISHESALESILLFRVFVAIKENKITVLLCICLQLDLLPAIPQSPCLWLQVRLNLGDGEGEVSSPADHRLDDLSWHEVSLERDGAQVTLTVDKQHKSRYGHAGTIFLQTLTVRFCSTHDWLTAPGSRNHRLIILLPFIQPAVTQFI